MTFPVCNGSPKGHFDKESCIQISFKDISKNNNSRNTYINIFNSPDFQIYLND